MKIAPKKLMRTAKEEIETGLVPEVGYGRARRLPSRHAPQEWVIDWNRAFDMLQKAAAADDTPGVESWIERMSSPVALDELSTLGPHSANVTTSAKEFALGNISAEELLGSIDAARTELPDFFK